MFLHEYDELTEEVVRSMPLEELQNAVIRMLKVKCKNSEDYYGFVLAPDELADAFRGR